MTEYIKGDVLRCPDCGSPVDVDYTPQFSIDNPYERVCYDCGWFDNERYKTKIVAIYGYTV